jgi:PPOX class probable F420-dependent enzyme
MMLIIEQPSGYDDRQPAAGTLAAQAPISGERTDHMSQAVEGRVEELLAAKNFCQVATLRRDGSIHAVPTWVDVQDGLPVLNTAEGRVWPANLQRDPRVTLTVLNADNPYEYVTIRGRVAERTHAGADEHIDALAKKYLGQDEYPYRRPGEQRVIIRVVPEHVYHYGA